MRTRWRQEPGAQAQAQDLTDGRGSRKYLCGKKAQTDGFRLKLGFYLFVLKNFPFGLNMLIFSLALSTSLIFGFRAFLRFK